MLDLPMAFGVGKAEMEVDQVQRAFGGFDDNKLGAARFFGVQAQRDLMLRRERPARED